MRKGSGLAASVTLAFMLAGCAGQGLVDGSTPDGEQLARVDPAAGSTPAPADDLGKAKEYFRDRDFGLAEKHFRAVIVANPRDVEAWLGLAATHDQLGRYDLADREYAQVARRGGGGVALLNNRGYSYMMRGDLARARKDFLAARRLEPDNEFLRNNLRELDAKAAGRS